MNRRSALLVPVLTAAVVAAAPLAGAAPAAATAFPSVVDAPHRLVAGDVMTSDNRAYTLTVQSDGNVVERRGAAAVWTTNTTRNPGAVLDIQTDGNLVVRSSTGRAIWTSGTPGRHGQLLNLQDTGELVLQSDTGSWSNGVGVPARRTVLSAGQTLRSDGNDNSVFAPHGRFSLYALLGLHISEYVPGFESGTWSPGGSAGGTPGSLTLQTDGNLVYRDGHGKALWASGSRGAALRLTMQDDGNVVIRRPDGGAVWSTGTGRTLLGSGEVAPSGTRFTIHRDASSPTTTLVVQPDGNVVRSGGNLTFWQTGTAGNPGARLTMQTDGNLVVRRPDGRAVWQSGTSRCGPSTFDANYGWIYAGYTLAWTLDGGSKGVC